MQLKAGVVTGGAQGIGRAISEALLRAGYRVAVLDPDGEALAELQADCAAAGLAGFTAVRGDAACQSDVIEVLRCAADGSGVVTVAVHNAGISRNGPVERLSLNDWQRVLDVNLTGAFLLARHAAPLLRRARGSIVNIASTRALMSEPHTEAYSASKGGILALTHALAVSLGPEIRVNAISPGWIETAELQKRSARAKPHHGAADRAQHPVGRVGRPDDIARAVLFLCDPANDFVTGHNFVIDGGMTRRMIYV
ncbi:MAG: SDR family oxidoreductase [Spirochaetaceae bacterium]|nr:MAG: SDR family oxidoreductase [Spirochaetaceae bacterium]